MPQIALDSPLLTQLLEDWRLLLGAWAQNGAMSRAALEALRLPEEPETLRQLIERWGAGDWRELPPVAVLPASAMPSAAGAYAMATGTIYLNQAWLQAASQEVVLSVLTEELGHHLDGLLNASDTPGDEGELFAALLLERPLTASAREAIAADNDQILIQAGSTTLLAEAATITGTELADTLTGGFGDDSITGLGGNDQIDGQAGADIIRGGDGNDTIEGNFGNDSLYGDAGDDTITDNQGTNTFDGGLGNDTLTTRSLTGNNTLIGGAGNDRIDATGLILSLDGGEGDDELNLRGELSVGGTSSYVQGGNAILSGGPGRDRFGAYSYSTAELRGGADNDDIYVSGIKDSRLYGDAGDDEIDVRVYGPSVQTLNGGDGNDSLTISYDYSTYPTYGRTTANASGGLGDDTISISRGFGTTDVAGGFDSVTVDGGAGNDKITVADSFSTSITTGSGRDTIILTAPQYLKLLVGTQLRSNPDGTTTSITPQPFSITDFSTGSGGDVIDYGDLLRNASPTYNGSNPFATGFLALRQNGADTLLSFDPDGTAGSTASTVVAILRNTTSTAFVADNFNPNYPTNGSPAAPQTITGTALADTLTGGFGDDSIDGLGGNDQIDGQAGADIIRGGDGNDTIEGNFGNDSLYGDAGDDTITDNQGTNTFDGGLGNDTLTTRSLTGNNTLIGGAGNDRIDATGLILSLDGGEGDDELNLRGELSVGGTSSYVQGGNAILSGGPGRDRFGAYSYSTAELRGGADNDDIYVSGIKDSRLYGDAGDDEIDVRVYGPSVQTLNGGDGNDSLTISYDYSTYPTYGRTTANASGGLGDDTISISRGFGTTDVAGGFDSVTVDGGAGNDKITVADSFSTSITTGSGRDTIILTAPQYLKLLVGTQLRSNPDGTTTSITPQPFSITDFSTGSGGDVIDYGDLLRNASPTYNGSNPFATGFLALRQNGADTLLSFDPDGTAGSTASTVVAILRNTTSTAFVADNFNPNYPVNGSVELPSITLAQSPASVTEDGTANLVYTFSRSGPTTAALTVNYTIGGTATLGTDYTGIAASPATKTVTFAAGSATTTVIVDPTIDATVEPDETISLTLAAGTGYTIGTTSVVTGTIVNDDSIIESAGNTALLRRSDGLAFAQLGSSTPSQIASPWGNSAIGSDTSAWQILAIDTIGGVNQLLWRNNTANFLHTWTLDANWNWTSSGGAFALNANESLALESSFQVDGNRDGIIGAPI